MIWLVGGITRNTGSFHLIVSISLTTANLRGSRVESEK